MADIPNHFFKFISPGSKFNLSIPRCFWTKLSGEGRDQPILRRGCGQWPVDISDTGVFGDGWRKFAEDNGVQEFDFVVFKHQGNLVFDLIVFDQSTCERQYPLLFDEMDVEDHITESDSIHTNERSKKLKKRKRNTYSSENKDKFQLDDRFSFVSVMAPTDISSSRVHVPMKFARSNGLITKRTRTEIVVMDEAQRTWPATLKITKAHSCLMGWRELRVQNHIQAGDSCMFKLVKHGEAAVFHIYNLGKKPVESHIQVKNESTRSTLKNHPYLTSTLKPKDDRPDDIGQVKSYNKGKYGSNHIDSKSFEEMDVKQPLTNSSSIHKHDTRHKAKVLQPIPPQIKENFRRDDDTCFVATMTPYSIRTSRLVVPMRFSRSNGLIIKRKHKQAVYTQIVIMDEKQRTWPATLEVRRTKIRLSGWLKLIKENHIQSGDSCMFELIKHRQTTMFKIYNLAKKPIQVKDSCSTHNNHGYFISTLKPCTLNKSSLYLPVDFSIPNGLETGKAILRDDKRRSWEVQLKKRGEKYFYVTGHGLKTFCNTNGLKEGDAYKFELVENEKDKPPVVNLSLIVGPTTPSGNDDCHTSSAREPNDGD